MKSFEDHCRDVIQKINIPALNELREKYSDCEMKYLNFPFEVPYKMTWALSYLMLHNQPEKQILDLGCGPGWFPFIAKHFNHTVHCHDLPSETSRSHMFYEDLLKTLGLKRDFAFAIKPQEKLSHGIGRYNVITALGMAFHHGWKIQDWYFFLDDITQNHFIKNGHGVLFIQANANSAWDSLLADNAYKNKPNIVKWEFFEKHMLRAVIKT